MWSFYFSVPVCALYDKHTQHEISEFLAIFPSSSEITSGYFFNVMLLLSVSVVLCSVVTVVLLLLFLFAYFSIPCI